MMGGFENQIKTLKKEGCSKNCLSYGLNPLTNICAVGRAAFPALMDYWCPGVSVFGTHELMGKALVMESEKERTSDLRLNDLPGKEGNE